jgi:hypothetical protein
MITKQRRPLKKSRHFRGEPWAANLVQWLNGEADFGKSTKPSRSRVLSFMSLFQDVMKAIESAPSGDLISYPTPRLNTLMNKLNRQLDEYPTYFGFYIDCGREWALENGVVGGRFSAGESIAMHGAIELAKLNLLSRVENCRCGRWFFARFRHQHFCSKKCRKKQNESSEQFKAARREYMRRYYRLKQSGKVR